MALLSALLSLVSQQIGSLVRAVLGWSVTALFGRLPSVKQTALAGVLIASLVWPVLVVGIVYPAVAAWGFAFVPLQKWWGVVPVRVLSIALSVLLPPVVGIVTARLAPPDRRKGGLLRAGLGGFPLTLGYAVSCLLTALVVPAVKIASAARRWQDEHAFVQPREGEYAQALEELVHACRDAGVAVRVQTVPWRLSAPTRILKLLARGAVDVLLAEDPKMLRGEALELYLYPADLLIRGEKHKVGRVQSCLLQTLLEQHAYLVTDPTAQKLADELREAWGVVERHADAAGAGAEARRRFASIEHDLDTQDVPFDDWLVLDRNLQRLRLALGGGTRITLPESDTRDRDNLPRHAVDHPQSSAFEPHT